MTLEDRMKTKLFVETYFKELDRKKFLFENNSHAVLNGLISLLFFYYRFLVEGNNVLLVSNCE